jgi:addiction module HigA family antidote
VQNQISKFGLTATQTAKDLGISRKALSELFNGKCGISPEMALRLAKAFNITPESWLMQQMHYDLWQARQKSKRLQVRKLWPKQSGRQSKQA